MKSAAERLLFDGKLSSHSSDGAGEPLAPGLFLGFGGFGFSEITALGFLGISGVLIRMASVSGMVSRRTSLGLSGFSSF